MTKAIVGGGTKKVLYTLQTIKRIGLKQSAKALKAKNTCKACGLGMGGQRGGMTNELDEFPAVCNKSIQAQSTDIQAPIPKEIFAHSLADLKELSAKELEHIGRLGFPIFKAADSSRYQVMSWPEAMQIAIERFREGKPEQSFFYSSGRSSNEAGFVLQLLARLYGTNNVNNCSYYCHQATSVGLASTIGKGTATVELSDLSGCDLVFVIGANPASNHPRFIHKLKAVRERGGQVIVINPAKEPGLVKFAVPKSAVSMIAGGSEIASLYVQPNIGSDLFLFKGMAKALLAMKAVDREFIDRYCENYSAFEKDIAAQNWADIVSETGLSKAQIEQLASAYARSKNAVFSWGMGMTHHGFGVENVEYIANLALLRGMVGKRFAGLLPLRGHSNVQGIGTIGVKPVLAAEVAEAIERHLQVRLPKEQGLDTYHCLKAAYQGDITCALIMGGNLYSASPNSDWTAKALDKIGFKLFLTTTLNQGHLHGVENSEVLILPVVARDEEAQPTTQESMFNYVRMSDGGIERIENARSEVEILADLGLGIVPSTTFDFSVFEQHDNIREAIAASVPGMEALKDISVAKKEFHISGRLMHEPNFGVNKKARFVVAAAPGRKQIQGEYPFILASVRSEGQFNSIIYEENDSYRYNAKRNALLMSPDDMSANGLKAGDSIDVVSKYGTLSAAQVHAFDLPPGNLMAYYPEANVLTGEHLDPRSLTPAFKSVAVKIVKADSLAAV